MSKKAKPVVIIIDGDRIVLTDTTAMNLFLNLADQMTEDLEDYGRDHGISKRKQEQVRDLMMKLGGL